MRGQARRGRWRRGKTPSRAVLAGCASCRATATTDQPKIVQRPVRPAGNRRYDLFAWVPPTEDDPTVESLRGGIVGDHAMARSEEEPGDVCHRQCCGSARRWNMTTRLLLPAGVPPREGEPRLRFTKPFKCTFLCFAPPVVFVWWGDHVIAEVVSPWVCCEWHFKVGPPMHFEDRTKVHPEVLDVEDHYWYTVSSPVCTSPLLCPCCYAQAKFKITDTATGAEAGSIGKIWPGCGTSLTNATHFGLTFPEDALPMQKASLLACTMLLDFVASENNSNNNH